MEESDMSRVFVPVSINEDYDVETALRELRAVGAERIFLACDRFPFERGERREKMLARIKKHFDFYSSAGLEVAIWITIFGFGGPMLSFNKKVAEKYSRITSITGRKCDDAICPMDKDYTEMMAKTLEDIITHTGTKMIMFDDEMCLNVRPGIGCACELHIAELSRRLGEEISREEIAEKVFTGGASRYRDAWMDVQGDSMRDFCRAMRAAVDGVDPTVRLGFASGFTSWDLECADAIELTHILAGNTEPFVRFTAAPYWVSNQRFARQTMQTVCEQARLQYVWTRGEGIEVFSEADTFPHNCYHTSAAFIECFDLALRVSDDVNDFKYFLDYVSQPTYETNYLEAHKKNMPVYKEVERVFNPKTSTGVRVYETMRKFKDFELPERFMGESPLMKRVSFCDAQKLLTSSGIPTTYVGDGVCGIVFGENAKYIDLSVCDKGLILDTKAAEILESRGVDTGLISSEFYSGPLAEKFVDGHDVFLFGAGPMRRIKVKDGAKIQSYYALEDEREPASYIYENKAGQRFMVLAFVGEEQNDKSALYWSYSRAEQIADNIKWLTGGAELPASCIKHPHLYLQAKESEDAIGVALINCHEDEVNEGEVKLAKAVENVRFIGCEGRQKDAHTVIINYIKPHGFAAFEAEFVK